MEEAVQTQTAPPRGNAPLFANRDLLRLLWPLVIEQTLAALVGMSDTVMVSSVGEAAISGVSLVDMINNLIINVFAALATGGAVVTSQFLGARKPQDASRSAGQLVTLSALLAWRWRPSACCCAHRCCGCSSAPSPTMSCGKR